MSEMRALPTTMLLLFAALGGITCDSVIHDHDTNHAPPAPDGDGSTNGDGHEPGDHDTTDPCHCAPGWVCHEETKACLTPEPDGCFAVDLKTRLGTFSFDTTDFQDFYSTFDCSTICGDDAAPTANTPEACLSWQNPKADVYYEFMASSQNVPLLFLHAFPIASTILCGGEPCCHNGSTGPPYVASTSLSSSIAHTRINFVIEGLDGSTGRIQLQICEDYCPLP